MSRNQPFENNRLALSTNQNLLTTPNGQEPTIAHHTALSGNPVALNWLGFFGSNAADGNQQTSQATSATLANNLSALAEQKNPVNRLLNPDHQLESQKMVEEIRGTLNIK